MANTRWEYRTIEMNVNAFWGPKIDLAKLTLALNDHGEEGWEMVNALDINEGQGRTTRLVAFFKRPVG